MARKLIEYKVSDSDVVSYTGYNSTKTVLGPMIYKFTGSSVNDYYISTNNLAWDNISQDIGYGYWGGPSILNYNDTTDYIFMNYSMPSFGNIRTCAYTFNKKTGVYNYLGLLNSVTQSVSPNYVSAPVVSMEYYTAGTVSVNGTLVSGTSTNWGVNQINAGTRIGFGSTNKDEITNWYEIGSVPLETNKFNGLSYASEVDSLGRIYVGGGGFTNYTHMGSAYTATRIIRLNPDGTPDLTFNSGSNGFNNTIRRIKIDPIDNTKIYVAGDFTAYSGITSARYIVRLNSDGTLDPTFSGGTNNTTPASSSFNNFVYDIAIDSLGRIYCCGAFTTYSGVAATRLCRLDYNGRLDTTFSGYTLGLTYSPNAGSTLAFCVAVEPVTDKVYIGGFFDRWNNTSISASTFNNIARINTNGSIDYTFSATTQFNGLPYTIQPDKFGSGIYVGGAFTTYSGVAANRIIKLTNNNTKDTSFDNTTGFNNNEVVKIRQTNKNEIFVSGSFSTYKGNTANVIVKLTSGGTQDNSFVPETYTSSLAWLSGQATLSDGFSIDENNGNVYATQQAASVAFNGLIAYTSGGTINDSFYGLNLQTLALTTSATTYPDGTPYVIEDLRILSVRAGNTASSGLYVVKGIKLTDFVTGTTQATSTTSDYYGINARTCYWLPTNSNSNLSTSSYALVLDEKSDWNNQNCYVMYYNNLILYAFNVRSRIRITTGSLNTNGYPDGYLFQTSSTNADSGLVALNNGLIIKDNFNNKSFYYIKNNAIRKVPIANIQSAVNFLNFSDTVLMSEVPPGNTTTYPANNSFFNINYMPEIDRFIISTNGTATKSYITKFNSNFNTPSLTNTIWNRNLYNDLSYENSFERAFLVNGQQLQGPSSNLNSPKYPDTQGSAFQYIASNGGWLHYVRGVNSVENIIYAIPIAADEQYVDITNNVIITPKFVIPNLVSITGFYLNTLKEIGSGVFSQSPEPLFVDFRTSGIDDNSGSWTNFQNVDDLNGLLCNNTTNNVTIQFRFRFRVAGTNCYPNRLYGFSFTYEDDTTDSHYSPSVSKSSLTNRVFAWQQVSLFGSSIPNMKIRVYNAENGDLLLYDTVSDSNLGVWQYSTDGNTWNAWSSSADTIGNYIRYTANYLPSNYKLRVGLNTV